MYFFDRSQLFGRINAKVVCSSFLLILTLLFNQSCDIKSEDQQDTCVIGIGSTVTINPEVDSFHSIIAGTAGNIFISQATPHSLSIITHQSILDILSYRINDHALRLRFERCIQQIQQFDAYITTPLIRQIDFLGVGEITAQNSWSTDTLTVNLSGVGAINLKGQAHELIVNHTGTGSVHAWDMSVENCSVTISGNGDVEITVSDALKVTINGVGNVLYRGDPVVQSTIVGNGNVIQVE